MQDRLISFDPDYLAHIPYLLKPIEPFVETVKNGMMAANASIGLPWWLIIVGACTFIRLTIMPLVLVQMRRVSQLAPIAPVLVNLKNTFKQSSLPRRTRLWLAIKATYQIIKGQNLKLHRLYIYNLLNIPLIITMVYSIRQLLSEP
jgi:membrane protein insertase Oxa1/YidC/SpoIIIJ